MSELQETLNQIKEDKDTNLLPENLKAGVTCLGVDGTFEGGTKLPDDVFIQEEAPTKTTNEAFWLKQSAKINFLDICPRLNDAHSMNVTSEFRRFTQEQKNLINSYKYHVVKASLSGPCIYASNNPKFVYLSGAFVYFAGSTAEPVLIAEVASGRTPTAVEYKNNRGTTWDNGNYWNLTVPCYTNNSFSEIAKEANLILNYEDGLNITNGDTTTVIYQNKGTDFEKILDTSNGTATAEDILQGKTAYVNNEKIIGIAERGIDTSDANATANDIRLYKSAYVNGQKIAGALDYSNSIIATKASITSTNYLDAQDNRSDSKEVIFQKNGHTYIPPELVLNALGLTADKIVKGNTILDIAGTAEALIPYVEDDFSGIGMNIALLQQSPVTADGIAKIKIIDAKYINGETAFKFAFTCISEEYVNQLKAADVHLYDANNEKVKSSAATFNLGEVNAVKTTTASSSFNSLSNAVRYDITFK